MAQQLGFGLNPLPPGVETAWGARAIITQDGHVDIVHDRTDAVGPDTPRQALLDHLRTQVKTQPWEKAKQLLGDRELSTREEKRVTLYEDNTVIVEANPNASAGYLYVVAYFKADRREERSMSLQLRINAPDAEPYPLDSYDLADAIDAEATTIAADADSRLLVEGTEAEREELRQHVIRNATHALQRPGDTYRDPTGVTWTLVETEKA